MRADLERHVRAFLQPMRGNVDLYAYDIFNGQWYAAPPLSEKIPISSEPVPEREDITTPTLRLGHEAAQELFDDLWNAGFRPNKGEGTAAHVDAMREHLADLRRLVFDHSVKKAA